MGKGSSSIISFYYSWHERGTLFTVKHGSWGHTKGLKLVLHSSFCRIYVPSSDFSAKKLEKEKNCYLDRFFCTSFFWWHSAPHNAILQKAALPRASPCTNIFPWCEQLAATQHPDIHVEETSINLNSMNLRIEKIENNKIKLKGAADGD